MDVSLADSGFVIKRYDGLEAFEGTSEDDEKPAGVVTSRKRQRIPCNVMERNGSGYRKEARVILMNSREYLISTMHWIQKRHCYYPGNKTSCRAGRFTEDRACRWIGIYIYDLSSGKGWKEHYSVSFRNGFCGVISLRKINYKRRFLYR